MGRVAIAYAHRADLGDLVTSPLVAARRSEHADEGSAGQCGRGLRVLRRRRPQCRRAVPPQVSAPLLVTFT